ncbi:MAG: hypothetical protein WAQ27_01310, partial [Candidatus Microsaccharimonas sp.]
MATHSVFGNDISAYYPINRYSDNGMGIMVGNVFYLTDANGPAVGWRVTGGRVYIPNDPLITGKSITVMVWAGNGLNPLNAAAFPPKQQIVTATPINGGWCEVTWDVPFIIDYGPEFSWVA